MDQGYCTTVTYDHRLERIGHPVRSVIYKLHNHLDSSLNRANRHSAEFKPFAALKGEAKVSRVSRVSIMGRSKVFRVSFASSPKFSRLCIVY